MWYRQLQKGNTYLLMKKGAYDLFYHHVIIITLADIQRLKLKKLVRTYQDIPPPLIMALLQAILL